MSMKHYAILLKAAGLAVFLVPLFMRSMGYITAIPEFLLILLIAVGLVLVIAGNVYETKALRTRKEKISIHK